MIAITSLTTPSITTSTNNGNTTTPPPQQAHQSQHQGVPGVVYDYHGIKPPGDTLSPSE